MRCSCWETLACLRMSPLMWQSTDRYLPVLVTPRDKSGWRGRSSSSNQTDATRHLSEVWTTIIVMGCTQYYVLLLAWTALTPTLPAPLPPVCRAGWAVYTGGDYQHQQGHHSPSQDTHQQAQPGQYIANPGMVWYGMSSHPSSSSCTMSSSLVQQYLCLTEPQQNTPTPVSL